MLNGNEWVKLANSECEKDLGVFVDSTLKFEHHSATIAKKGNQMTGLLLRTFEYVDEEMFLVCKKWLDLIINTPHQCGLPTPGSLQRYWKGYKDDQQRTSLATLEYEDRPMKLKLPTLVYWRLQCEKCIQVPKQNLRHKGQYPTL